MNHTILPPAKGKIEGPTGYFILGITTALREGNLRIRILFNSIIIDLEPNPACVEGLVYTFTEHKYILPYFELQV